MRQSRIRGIGLSYYHVLSRVVDWRFILGEVERTHFVAVMRKLKAFRGLRVVTYVVLSNHFHLLEEDPDRNERPALDRERLDTLAIPAPDQTSERLSRRRAQPNAIPSRLTSPA